MLGICWSYLSISHYWGQSITGITVHYWGKSFTHNVIKVCV